MNELIGNRNLDRLIETASIIEASHALEFKVSDYINKDAYRKLKANALLDNHYLELGEKNIKGNTIKPNKTNMVFAFYFMIVNDLKSFGVKTPEIHKVKAYLFKEFDILKNIGIPTDRNSLLNQLNAFWFEDETIKEELTRKINSGEFLSAITDKSVSRLFLVMLKMLSTGRDIQLYIDSTGEALFVDDFEFSQDELNELSYDSRIVLPIKKYFLFFIGEYASSEFLTRSKILSPKEALILEELKRNDILSLTVKYHNGKPNTFESKRLEKVEIQARLSEVLLKGGFEDIVLRTKQGNIFYSEITTKTKL